MNKKQRIELVKTILQASYNLNNYLSIVALTDKIYISYKECIITLTRIYYGWSWWGQGLIMSSHAQTFDNICKELTKND